MPIPIRLNPTCTAEKAVQGITAEWAEDQEGRIRRSRRSLVRSLDSDLGASYSATLRRED